MMRGGSGFAERCQEKVTDKMTESLLQSKIRINTQGFKVKVNEGRQTGSKLPSERMVFQHLLL